LRRNPADLHVLNGNVIRPSFEFIANPPAGFPANGAKRPDGDASLFGFTDETLVEPAHGFLR
jgi:hypothetical protein